jgi:hypothetical protein
MDPFGALVMSLGALFIIDFAAHRLGGTRRPRARVRTARQR